MSDHRSIPLLGKRDASPGDAERCYELGLALLGESNDEKGVQYLDRAFRLDPLNIVRFVASPELKAVRLRPSVVKLMRRLEEEHRSCAAYA